jgi:hypothetical protein
MSRKTTNAAHHAHVKVTCLLSAACMALLTGCAPKVDQSGWEIARKKSPTERLETYPDIPLVLPGRDLPAPTTTGTSLESVLKQQMDVGSLFRRGYSAPTP